MQYSYKIYSKLKIITIKNVAVECINNSLILNILYWIFYFILINLYLLLNYNIKNFLL